MSHYLLKGTFTLTAAGILARIAGFFYKIFLSRVIGAEEIGLFHLCMPVYAFCIAAACGGIQTVLSRFTAEYAAKNDRSCCRRLLLCALCISLTLSLLCSTLLYVNAVKISAIFLAESRCAALLRILSVSLPFCVLHACVSGYFIGLKNVSVPAASQIAEQAVRILSVLFFYYLFHKYGKKMDAVIMALGQLAGEIASSLFCLFFLHRSAEPSVRKIRNSHFQQFFTDIRRIFSASAPLGLNRMFLCVLQAIEAALLPQQLRLFGLSATEALSSYGTLTGMAMPLLLFPTAVSSSLGTLLLPLVSEARALNQEKRIAAVIKNTVEGSLLLGFFFLSAFFLLGHEIGILLFGSKQAGEYIRMLSLICPFLYLNTTASNILHGLGKTTAASIQNTLGFLLRLASVLFLIPASGIRGYFAGMLLGHVFITVFTLFTLQRSSEYRLSLTDAVLRPVLICLLTTASVSLLKIYVPALKPVKWLPFIFCLLLCLLIFLALICCCYPKKIQEAKTLFPYHP